jgi:hypothetical protein
VRANSLRIEELQAQAITAAEEFLAGTEIADARVAADWCLAARNATLTALNCEQIIATRRKVTGRRQ